MGNKPITMRESYRQRLLFLCVMILTTVTTNIVVDKSTDNAEPLSICSSFFGNPSECRNSKTLAPGDTGIDQEVRKDFKI